MTAESSNITAPSERTLSTTQRLSGGGVRIAPSLLSADFSRFAEGARVCVEAGADWLHFDVMDGRFVPNLTFGVGLVKALRPEFPDIPFDVHLMVEEPERYIETFAEAGADLITVHVEASVHLQRTLSAIRDLGCRAGVALNPATPPTQLAYVLDDLDLVLVMTVNPGFGGQKFIAAAGDKVGDIARLREQEGVNFLISVDGGVDDRTAPGLLRERADVLVSGSYLFGHPESMAKGIATLRGNPS
jgi:ribulose-phosphate 3-epimerase